MNLQIRPCDNNNREHIEALTVAPSQHKLIETNYESLKEADEFSYWRPVGLYDNETLVGFAMYGMCDDGTVWLDRLMIDTKFQNKGYGSQFLQLLVNTIKKEYRCQKIYLSYLPQNISAYNFYAKAGFTKSGDTDPNGEIIMCLI